jgi:hypothetical protein
MLMKVVISIFWLIIFYNLLIYLYRKPLCVVLLSSIYGIAQTTIVEEKFVKDDAYWISIVKKNKISYSIRCNPYNLLEELIKN